MGQAMHGRVGESGKHSGQVIADWGIDSAAGFDDRENGGDFGSGLLAANVDPVFTTKRNRSHGVFGKIVTQLEFWVFQEARQFLPKGQGVVAGFTQDAGG